MSPGIKGDAVKRANAPLIPNERIERIILLIRGQKIILDRDLAALYGVETRDLNKAVHRNLDRFPNDFLFQLTHDEFEDLKFHFGTSSWGGTRKLPYAFTELGIAMLSSVLKSKQAVRVNIQILRMFVALRQLIETHKDLARKLDEMEKEYDQRFQIIFEAIRQLLEPPAKSDRKIGFRVGEPKSPYRGRPKR
jgi:hypothetical protein